MRAIFISYRRDDTEGHAGRLFEDLRERFGAGSVFMDVAGIEPGRDFRRVIEQQVSSCGVLLAVIGKNWLGIADAQGRRRLDDPSDFVRLETASALKRDIPVIPVLVHQATMPRAEDLPDDLKELAFRNSVELTHARWGSDVQLLITALMPYVDPAQPSPPAAPTTTHRARWVVAPLAVLAVGGVGYLTWDRRVAAPDAGTDAESAPTRVAASAAAPTPTPTPTPTPGTGPARIVATPSSAPSPAPPPAPPAASPAETAIGARSPIDEPAAPQAGASRRTDRPAIARALPAPRTPTPSAVVVPARPPAPPIAFPAPAPSPSPAPAPAPTPAASPSPSPPPAPSPATPTPPAPAPVRVAAAPPSPSSREIVASRQDPSLELFGSPGAVSMVTRTIAIRPDTSYVNVTGGEVIRFDVGDKSFIWNFNGTRSNLDLSRIVPPSVLDRKVTAYIAPNPLYPRRN